MSAARTVMYILWALPRDVTDRLHERPLTSFALTRAQADKVILKATEDGWHGFRLVPDDNEVPDFAAAIVTPRTARRNRRA